MDISDSDVVLYAAKPSEVCFRIRQFAQHQFVSLREGAALDGAVGAGKCTDAVRATDFVCLAIPITARFGIEVRQI